MHESELETILSGDIDGHIVALNPRTELPRGMFDWTTKDTLIGDRGGWNCRHQFFGVSEWSAVPEEVREKLEEKRIFAAMKTGSKERIKELRAWAKDNLLDKEVNHPEFTEKIRFTNTGIKEFLNQPHKDFFAKNELLKDIVTIIQKSKVVHNAPDMKENPNNHFYYLETKIGNNPSYVVIRLTRHNNQYALYSIVDKIKNR